MTNSPSVRHLPVPSAAADGAVAALTYIGHSTVLIEAGGARVLTDPMLRSRTAHLRRHGPAPNLENLGALDAVLLSHLHLDHCDLRSLALLGKDVRLLAPPGAGSFLRRRGFRAVEELPPGATARVGGLIISPTPARHSGRRPPLGPVATATGFLLEGALRRLYFAGDTDLFPEMADLALGPDGRPLDAALLPVWGWGPTLGAGHLDPHRAALALRLLRPSVAVPIHWGTFRPAALPRPRGYSRPVPTFLTEPPSLFAHHAALLAPEVAVRILSPGGRLVLSP